MFLLLLPVVLVGVRCSFFPGQIISSVLVQLFQATSSEITAAPATTENIPVQRDSFTGCLFFLFGASLLTPLSLSLKALQFGLYYSITLAWKWWRGLYNEEIKSNYGKCGTRCDFGSVFFIRIVSSLLNARRARGLPFLVS